MIWVEKPMFVPQSQVNDASLSAGYPIYLSNKHFFEFFLAPYIIHLSYVHFWTQLKIFQPSLSREKKNDIFLCCPSLPLYVSLDLDGLSGCLCPTPPPSQSKQAIFLTCKKYPKSPYYWWTSKCKRLKTAEISIPFCTINKHGPKTFWKLYCWTAKRGDIWSKK